MEFQLAQSVVSSWGGHLDCQSGLALLIVVFVGRWPTKFDRKIQLAL